MLAAGIEPGRDATPIGSQVLAACEGIGVQAHAATLGGGHIRVVHADPKHGACEMDAGQHHGDVDEEAQGASELLDVAWTLHHRAPTFLRMPEPTAEGEELGASSAP